MGLRGSASPARRALVARIANTSRHHPDRDITDLRRELGALMIEDAIKAVVDQAPPLTSAQRERLANLLRSGRARDEVA